MNKSVMFLVDNLYLAILHSKFKHGDEIIAHELSGYCTTNQAREFFGTTQNILMGLYCTMFVASYLFFIVKNPRCG